MRSDYSFAEARSGTRLMHTACVEAARSPMSTSGVYCALGTGACNRQIAGPIRDAEVADKLGDLHCLVNGSGDDDSVREAGDAVAGWTAAAARSWDGALMYIARLAHDRDTPRS